MQLDLRGLRVEEVADVIFGHEAPRDATGNTNWWWNSTIVFEPVEHIAHLTALFRQCDLLRARYTRDQLEQGFWFLISGAPGGLEDLIWEVSIPWDSRAALIEATVDLYRQLFAKDSLDTSAYMFWDALAYGYCVPTRYPETDVEDRRVQDAMFAALQEILTIDSLDCQLAALHGLGHLRHPDTEVTIARYLERNPALTDEYRQFARACVTGDIE